MTFGQQIKKWRKARGLKQKDLSRLLCVSPSTISNYENDVHMPPLDTLRRLAAVLQVPLSCLLEEEPGVQAKVLALFSGLSPAGQKKALDLLRQLATGKDPS